MRNHTLRRAFTLMEVMTALAVSALVATLAATSLHASLDVRERVQGHRATVEAEARAIGWLTDMLRHAPAVLSVTEPMFAIGAPGIRGGLPAPLLTFLTEGMEQPFGTGDTWRVTLRSDEDGLHLVAEPLDASSGRQRFESVLPHIATVQVQVMASSTMADGRTWRTDWPLLRAMPQAVQLTFILRDGTLRTPVVIALLPLPGTGS